MINAKHKAVLFRNLQNSSKKFLTESAIKGNFSTEKFHSRREMMESKK
jgi:GTP cyclohydrolase I